MDSEQLIPETLDRSQCQDGGKFDREMDRSPGSDDDLIHDFSVFM